MKCIFCGAEITENAKYCAICGREQLAQENSAPEQQPVMSEQTTDVNNTQAAPYINSPGAFGTGAPSMAQSHKKLSTKVKAIIGAAAGALIVLFIVILAFTSDSKLESVYDKYCNPMWASITEDGTTLTIDTNPYNIEDEISFEAISAIEEINKELRLGDGVFEKMKTTRAIDGMQSVTKKGYIVTWIYHPEKGLEVVYEKE